MAYILIDGYNLIGIAHNSLDNARKDIVNKLSRYSELKGHSITLVFDGWKDGQPDETRMRTGNINIIYSRIGEKADLVIKRILSQGSQPWIVVSSDREISDYALRKNFVPVTADEFENKLYKCIKNSGQDNNMEFIGYDDEDDDVASGKRKGSSQRPSKKLKRKIQALKKL